MPGKLAAMTTRPAQVLVAHYFNPPHLMPLVELVRHPETSDETVETMFALYTRIGKKPVIIQHEAPGFVANRLQMAVWREAANIVARGICTPQDVDTVVRYGLAALLGGRAVRAWRVDQRRCPPGRRRRDHARSCQQRRLRSTAARTR